MVCPLIEIFKRICRWCGSPQGLEWKWVTAGAFTRIIMYLFITIVTLTDGWTDRLGSHGRGIIVDLMMMHSVGLQKQRTVTK